MSEQNKRSAYMDYRDSVPFMDLSGYIVRRPAFTEELPVKSLKEYLFKKKFPVMVNLRRMRYCMAIEGYKNGRR